MEVGVCAGDSRVKYCIQRFYLYALSVNAQIRLFLNEIEEKKTNWRVDITLNHVLLCSSDLT